MINRISEIPFWGPEEQIRRFINQHDDPDLLWSMSLELLNYKPEEDETPIEEMTANEKQALCERLISKMAEDEGYESGTAEWDAFVSSKKRSLYMTQRTLSQKRIANIDEIFQKQLIWSYGRDGVDDAYFYWDWCPDGMGTDDDPLWKIVAWEEYQDNLTRDINRSFNYKEFVGYTNTRSADEMVVDYDARDDEHAISEDPEDPTTLDKITLRHNIMRSYLEVSEWLGDGAVKFGSHNGYVSRKMSLCWLFDAIRALINWKMQSQDKWAEADIYPLVMDGKDDLSWVHERFLNESEKSSQEYQYNDQHDLNQTDGRCAVQKRKRAKEPWKNGVLKVRGNEFHYGERADFYTHNSFIGECRFFHNARFLGQTTFDKEINGTAMRSRWADLAEFKEADKEYQPGTLVMFGGEKEITLSRNGVANAIVTTKPGLTLNGDNYPGKIMVGIALTGTVPVRIVDKVRKFDRLVASRQYPGYARKKKWWEFWKKPIAIALESWPAGGMVNCITKMEF